MVSEKRLKDLQALIIIGSEVARENRAAGQTIMMNLAAVSQGRRRLSSFVGEALDMQSLQSQAKARKSITENPTVDANGRRMTQKSLASLQQIADLKKLASLAPVPRAGAVLARGELADAGFAARVAELRAQGERVVLALAGADNDPAELGCDRELVSAGDGWTLQSISS